MSGKNFDIKKIKGPIGVVDVGSHFTRLEIVQVRGEHSYESLDRLNQTIPLGMDVFTSGKISAENTEMVGLVLRDFAKLMKEYGVKHVRALATAAPREATNSELFVNRVKTISGIEVSILETSEEARLIFLTVKELLNGNADFNCSSCLMCAIGTGSTQISFIEDGELCGSETVNVGSLRLIEQLDNPVASRDLQETVAPFVSTMVRSVASQSFVDITASSLLIAVGASVRTFADLLEAQNLLIEDNPRYRIFSKDDFDQFYQRCISGKQPTELAEKHGISDTLAESLETSCVILHHFLDYYGTERVLVPSVTTRDAIIRDFIREVSGCEDPFVPHLVTCAETMGEKYNFDRDHARNVSKLALRLFDKTRRLHGINEHGKLLLRVAALLHDIGLYVNSRSHHKHSCYLIQNNQLPGLRDEDQRIVAAIARYHRRGLPKSSHSEYKSLDSEQRVLVNKLAAILRIADSLDFARKWSIKDININFENHSLDIAVDGPVDVLLENWAVRRKANLFQEVFGLRTIIMAGE